MVQAQEEQEAEEEEEEVEEVEEVEEEEEVAAVVVDVKRGETDVCLCYLHSLDDKHSTAQLTIVLHQKCRKAKHLS